ncbi:MAG: glycosyltransferase family 4 protein [Acidobacteriota bacterium]
MPRFGDEVVGGSERFALHAARALVTAGHVVDVISSTATDDATWTPHYPVGPSAYSPGITVTRFNNDRPRWVSGNGIHPLTAYGLPSPSLFVADIIRHGQEDALETLKNLPLHRSVAFIEEQGPFSKSMFAYLRDRASQWDRVLFVPYLHPTTLVGSRMIPADKVVIMLAAHNEIFIHFPVFREYRRYRWGVFYASEGDLFASAVGGPPERGVGIVVPHPLVSRVMPPKRDHHPALAFVGRASPEKCVDRLIEAMDHVPEHLEGPLKGQRIGLHLVGTVDSRLRESVESRPWITQHGNMSTSCRDEMVSRRMALVNPSLLDSMGLVNLEAAFVGTPVLMNTDCPAFLELAERSGGTMLGFSIYDPVSLARAIDAISAPDVRLQVASEAQEWVRKTYTPEAFLDSLTSLLRL